MKTKVLLVIFLLFSSVIFAETIIKDGEKVYGKWKKSGSPYIIKGEAIVPQGKTLEIKPGVVVKFKVGNVVDYRTEDGYLNRDFNVGFLRVEGKLIAKGKKRKRILFTHNEKYGKWGNIVFVNTSDIEMEYCIVEFSQYIRLVTEDDNATGSVSFLNSKGTLKNCIFRDSWTGVNCKQGAYPTIKNCIVMDNEYGVESNSESKPRVINTVIWNNDQCFYINPGAKILLEYSLIQDDYLENGVYDKGNNILDENPKLKKDYKVDKNSPCYKAGKDNDNIGLEKTLF